MIKQFIKFSIVGVIASIVDVGLLVLLRELLHFDVLVAAAISFTVSLVVNYVLSMAFVFKGKNQSRMREFIIFVVLSIGDLLLNQLILWLGITFTTINYVIVKIISMTAVSIYNFVTRKIFLESKEDRKR
ncbi:MAG: GtrA family protein [Clostridia bacterium]|nr:GtrA family protein [Clostridia bacterium]